VLYGKEGNRYLMKDPYRYRGDSPEKKLYLTERYKHMGKDPAQAITGVIWFQGTPKSDASAAPKPVSKPEKIPVPANTFKVYSTAEGLALRASPSLSGGLLSRLPLHAELLSLEPDARRKVDKINEWMHVQTSNGDQGYVAAWYLTLSLEEEMAKETAPKTGDKSLIVRPTTSGLAFRTAPQVAPYTMIKRLPAGASLIVMEPIETSQKKIGVRGKWLKVKDITGKVGYVAAWYVTRDGQPALGVRQEHKSARPTKDDTAVLRTTTEGVALRSAPRVAPDTLIKRMPNATELTLLNPSDESKIGIYGQWVHARDIEDDEGYVAAWYVVRR
jgi:hypothetical protein